MKINNCIVCNRISPKIVAKYAHLVFKKYDKEFIHEIIKNSCETINYIDIKYRIFFCGKSHQSILSGLFYLLAIYYKITYDYKYNNNIITQSSIACCFEGRITNNPNKMIDLNTGKYKKVNFTSVGVRNSYKNWEKLLVELEYKGF